MVKISENKRISYISNSFRIEEFKGTNWEIVKGNYYVNPLALIIDIDNNYAELVKETEMLIKEASEYIVKTLKEDKNEKGDLFLKLNENQIINAKNIHGIIGIKAYCYTLREKKNDKFENTVRKSL